MSDILKVAAERNLAFELRRAILRLYERRADRVRADTRDKYRDYIQMVGAVIEAIIDAEAMGATVTVRVSMNQPHLPGMGRSHIDYTTDDAAYSWDDPA